MKQLNSMQYTLTTKYRSAIRKGAILNVAMLIGLTPFSTMAKDIACSNGKDCDVSAGDRAFFNSSENMVMDNSISGTGDVAVVPVSSYDSTLTLNGDFSKFEGTFLTAQYSSDKYNGKNAFSTLIFKNWDPNQTIKLGTSAGAGGNVIFDGVNEVKLAGNGTNAGYIYLNNNKLNTTSGDNLIGSIFLGKKGIDDNGRTTVLEGYKNFNTTQNATLYAGGSNNIANGNVNTTINDSTFNMISGNGLNTTVNGDINLTVNNSDISKIYGNLQHTSQATSMVNGSITVNVNDSHANDVIGESYQFIYGGDKTIDVDALDYDVGTTGKVTVNVNNSVIEGSIRGANQSATNEGFADWRTKHFKVHDVELNIENSVIGSEIIGLGSYVTDTDSVVINLKGETYVGYVKDENGDLQVSADALKGDTVVRAGTKRQYAVKDATINIDTAGANTVKIYGAIIAGSEASGSEKGTVSNSATINLMNTGTGEGNIEALEITSGLVDDHNKTSLNLTNVNVTAKDTVEGFHTINVDDHSVLTTKTLTLAENDNLNIVLTNSDAYGKVNAEEIDANGANLNLIVAKAGTYKDVLTGEIKSNFNKDLNNTIYNLSLEDGSLDVALKSEEELADSLGTPITKEEAQILASMLSLDEQGTPKGQQIAEAMSLASQTGNGAKAVQGIKDLKPSNSELASSLARETTKTLEDAVYTRLNTTDGVNQYPRKNLYGAWIQNVYNHSKQDTTRTSDGFSADTKGITFGLDGQVNNDVKLGFGYGYLKSDADSQNHDIDVKGHNLFVYGQYKPSQWYVDGLFNYGFSKYTDTSSSMGVGLRGKYDVDTYATSIMSGYDLRNGFSPVAGLRYIKIKQDSYNDGVQEITSKDSDILTAVAGIKYATDYQAQTMTITPSAHVNATYDLVSDDNATDVQIIGADSYHIAGKRLNRFGIEAGIGLNGTIDNWDIGVKYSTALRKDYNSHAGILEIKYNF